DVITSPPYIDSIDYAYNQMLEYFWLLPELGLSDYSAYAKLRKVPLGFNRVPSDVLGNVVERLSRRVREKFLRAVQLIDQRSPKEAEAVISFFYEFRGHCESVY